MFDLAPATFSSRKTLPRASGRVKPDPRSAVLRWRTRWLLPKLGPKARLAARFLPVLLQTSFDRADLRAEAPGVEGMKTRPGWGDLARAFGLNPPRSGQRGRRLVSAVLALPGPKLRLLVLPNEDLGEREAENLRLRLHAAKSVLAPSGVELQLLIAPYPPELLFFGALLAGQLPQSFWKDVDLSACDPLQQKQVIALATTAPTPLASLLCLLLASRSSTAPALVLKNELETGTSARALSDPEFFLCRWASVATGFGQQVRLAVQVGASRPSTRALVATDSRPLRPDQLIAVGRTLWVAAAQAIRSVPLDERKPLLDRLRAESVMGIPLFIIRHVSGTLEALAPPIRHGPRRVEIRDTAGHHLSVGPTTEHAVARALALLCAVQEHARPAIKGIWERVLPQLASKLDRRTVVTVPLPRAEAAASIDYALWLILRPGGRPSARIIRGADLLPAVLRELSRGTALQVVSANEEVDSATSRLDRTIVQVTAALRLGNALALHDGSRVLSLHNGRVRRIGLNRYLARPRGETFISSDPTIANPTALGRRWTSPTIECQIFALNDEQAGLIYLDGNGHHFRETLPIRHLEAHVRDAQQMLRQLPVPALLAIRATSEIASLVSRNFDEPTFSISLGGRLPFGLQVRIGEETFGYRRRWGLGAAAQQILSQWPPGVMGRISVQKAAVTGPDSVSPSLYLLYVRSAAIRRIYAYLQRST